ncbi:MAG: hypothetical protein ACRELB_12480 [Polyangiaceae bacterium]
MDECEKLSARVDSLEAAFRRRAERARDERDIATMVKLRDAAKVANDMKAERGALAANLAADLDQAKAHPTPAGLDAVMARLEQTATKSRELAKLYESFVAWEAEPS